ncbi:MAG: transcriptional repressor [Chloroflexota bacterium]
MAARDDEAANSGMRNTRQRSLILEVIRRGHLDADEIYRLARRQYPRLSLSTVYRTLQKLKRMGMIEELHFDEAHHHYELKGNAEHHHLVCLGCGKVIEFQHPLSRYIRRNVAAARGFDIADTEVKVSGYCADCRKKSGNKSGKTD